MSKSITVWSITYASADHRDIGCGTSLFLTEGEMHAALTQEVVDYVRENYFDDENLTDAQVDAYLDAEEAKIRALSLKDTLDLLNEQRNSSDYMSGISTQKHELAGPPDLSSIDKVEEFLS